MNSATIAFIIALSALSFYVIFLVLGVSGIAKNHEAQGLNRNKLSDK